MGTYYGPKILEPYVMAFWDPVGFLDGEWSLDKQKAFNNLYNFSIGGFAPFRDQFDSILNSRDDAAYLNRYGMDWSDVKDPRKLKQSGDAPALSGINFLSDNIKRLYK